MFGKDETLVNFKNKNCKIQIKIYKVARGTIYILYKDFSNTIRLYTGYVVDDFKPDYWRTTSFPEILNKLLDNVVFVDVKKKFLFSKRRVRTIRRLVSEYVNFVKAVAFKEI